MSGDSITGGKFIAHTLKAYGVDHVFFVDAILRRALIEMEEIGIRRILTHSEKAAAYMADGYARAGYRPGVCMAQSVGAANLAAGLQDAYLGNSPVIAMTGRQVSQNQYRNAYQELPHEPLFSAVTRFSGRADRIEQLPHLLRMAFRESTSSTPRPVHLDIAGHTGDVLGREQIEAELQCDERFSRVPPFRSLPEASALQALRVELSRSRRPVIVVDRGAMIVQAESAIALFAETVGVPVVASLDGKTVLVDDHPLNGGIVGNYSRACANQIVHEADLVIFAGSDTGDQVTANWTLPKAGTRVVQIDPDPLELGRNFAGALLLQGDVRATFEALLTASSRLECAPWLQRVVSLVAEWRESADQWRGDTSVPIKPAHLCAALSEWLPENALLVADTGYSSQWAGTLVYMNHQRQRFLRAAGSLGWSFPAAMGAKCALPDQPVVCFTGDGGFMYHMAELETARRWGINTITIVNNNQQLAQGAANIDVVYRGRSQERKHEIHVFRDTNFARLAREHGCFGIRVERPEDLPGAFAEAHASGLPAVIDVVTDPAARPVSGSPPRPT
jgi:acetolactate synthase-1/2/3 large subunit